MIDVFTPTTNYKVRRDAIVHALTADLVIRRLWVSFISISVLYNQE